MGGAALIVEQFFNGVDVRFQYLNLYLTYNKHTKLMAVDLRCPNCEDNLGKDTENSILAYCGNCGERNIYNERGDTEGLTDAEKEIVRQIKAKRARNQGRIISRYR